MANFGVELSGPDRLAIKLTQISDGIPDALKWSLNEIGELVANEGRDNVAVKTGDLKQSIRVEEEDDGVYVRAGGPGYGTSPDADRAGGVFYAWYQEMGTSKMPEHPFLRPAVETVTGIDISDKIARQWKALWE